MGIIRAKSISNFAYKHLHDSQVIRIHSVFDKSMNLMCDNELIYIGSRALPFGIQIDEFNRIRNASWVYFNNDALYFNVGSILEEVRINDVDYIHDIHEGILVGTEWKITYLKKYIDSVPLESLKNYLGRGIGLTPSGDDFILGLYSVSFCDSKLERLMGELGKINFSEYTTSISAQYLELARLGRFNPDLISLLETDDFYLFEKLFHRIFNIGASSGKDTLEGVLKGMEIIEKLANAHK